MLCHEFMGQILRIVHVIKKCIDVTAILVWHLHREIFLGTNSYEKLWYDATHPKKDSKKACLARSASPVLLMRCVDKTWGKVILATQLEMREDSYANCRLG